MSLNTQKLIFLISILALAAFLTPFFMHVAGDAQVHLAVAESFVKGRPFQYNENGPLVVASTSPFWTLILTGLFSLFGYLTPIALKILTFLLWATTAYLLYTVAQDIYKLSKLMLWCLMLIYVTCTAIIANALSGMENVLSSVQLLLIYLLTIKFLHNFESKEAITTGLLLGWTALTRPDAGFLGLIMILLFFLSEAVISNKEEVGFLSLLKQLIVVAFSCIAVLVPWYLYQYHITGSLVTDSSVARLYAGRRGSFEIIKGSLYFHPKAIFTIATVFFPIFVGSIFTSGELISRFNKSAGKLREKVHRFYPEIATAIILISSLIFYSFVVGADHFGRYFLPVFPFLFLFGFQGLQSIYDRLYAKNSLLARASLIIAIGYLALGNGLDYYRRTVKQIQVGDNLSDVVKAPLKRGEFTDNYLKKLGVSSDSAIKVAVTEVQLRYFVDDRITVVSLDGRTSAKILGYIDKYSGIPDFEEYFEDVRPDFVELGQWDEVGGWTSLLFPTRYSSNLMCQWQKKTTEMTIGQRFDWNGRQVTYVAPGKLRIDW